MPTLDYAISEYLDHLAKQRVKRGGEAHSTVATRRSYLTRAAKMLPNADVSKITPKHIFDLFYGEGGLAEKGLADGTLAAYKQALSAFFTYCEADRRKWIKPGKRADLLADLGVHESTRTDWTRLTPAQCIRVLDLQRLPHDRVYVAMVMLTGMRHREIVNLKWRDVNFDAAEITQTVYKRNGMPVKVKCPMPNALSRELRQWRVIYEQDEGVIAAGGFSSEMIVCAPRMRPNPAIHRSEDGSRMVSPDYLPLLPNKTRGNSTELIHDALRELGLDGKGEGFHTLRRSYARNLYEYALTKDYARDEALEAVRARLNHKSVDQTRKYIGADRGHETARRLLAGGDFLDEMVTGDNVVSLTDRREAR